MMFNKPKTLENIYSVLLYRILLLMSLFTVCRVGFYMFNLDMFPGLSFPQISQILFGGFIFDLSGILHVNVIYIALMIIPFDIRYHRTYQRVLTVLFLVTNGAAIAANTADFIYYRFILKRTTAAVFDLFVTEGNLPILFFRFVFDYWHATVFFLVVFTILAYLHSIVIPVKPRPSSRFLYHATNFILTPIIAGLVIAGIRGGFRHSTRPITISNAAKYVENPRDIALILNTPFSVIRTYDKKTLKKLDYFTDDELAVLYDPIYKPESKEAFKNKNVIIIILESIGREYISALNRDLLEESYEGYTPFLDSLIESELNPLGHPGRHRLAVFRGRFERILADSLESGLVESQFLTGRLQNLDGSYPAHLRNP